MPLPDGLTYITVSGTVSDPASLVIFKTPVWLIGNPIVPRFGLAAELNEEGAFSVELPATDDPAWVPVDWTYDVEIYSGGQVLTGTLAVPYDGGSIVLDDALQVDQAADTGQSYLLLSARGAAGGVAALNVDGDVLDGAGAVVGGPQSWAEITGKPSTFAPSAHAASHADGGADEITVRTSQVTGWPDTLDDGEALMNRDIGMGGVTITSGALHLSYFTATKTETVTSIITATVETAAADNTLARIGVWSVNSEGGLVELLASTANLASLWASTYSNVTRALQTPWNKVAGTRYAVGFLSVGGTPPALIGLFPSAGLGRRNPRVNGIMFAQSDLPASASGFDISEDYRKIQAVLITT